MSDSFWQRCGQLSNDQNKMVDKSRQGIISYSINIDIDGFHPDQWMLQVRLDAFQCPSPSETICNFILSTIPTVTIVQIDFEISIYISVYN